MRKIYANLKSVIGAVVMVSMLSTAALTTSCADYDEEIKDLQTQIDHLGNRVETLENNFEALSGALNGIVLDAEQDANGNWVITTDNGKINITVEGDFANNAPQAGLADGGVTVVEENGNYYWAVMEGGVATPLLVNGEKVSVAITPEVRTNPVTGKTEFSVDGTNWYAIGVVFENVAVEGNELVLTLGGGEVVRVPMAMEVAFDVKSGKLFFAPGETKVAALAVTAISEMFVVATPENWVATVEGNNLVVTAPEENPAYDPNDWWNTESPVLGDANGLVKVLAIGEDGSALVGSLKVSTNVDAVAVQAFGDTAYFTSDSYYDYYYGVTKKSDYQQVINKVADALKKYDYTVLESLPYASGDQEVKIADILGSEPEVGEEYIVWALIDDYQSYEANDAAYCFYQVLNAEIVVTEVAAFDIQVEINIEGAQSYIALAMPEDYYQAEADDWSESTAGNMVSYYQMGQVYGIELTENYKGSLLDVAAGTQYGMSGYYAPNKKQYLLVLPIDGRPIEDYTEEDVIICEQANAGVTKGGEITLTIEQVYEYPNYDGSMKPVNKYNEVYVAVTPSEGWHVVYNLWLTDEDLALYGSDDELINAMLKQWGNFASDASGKNTLYIPNTGMEQGESINYVAIAMDVKGQYTQVYKQKVSTSEMEYSETLSLAVSGDDMPLESTVTLDVATTGTATLYRYVCFSEDDSLWQYTYQGNSNKAADQLLMNTYSEWNNPSVEVTSLENNQVVLSGLKYDVTHHFFIVAFDENNLPCRVQEFVFTPLFYIGEILPTTDASYEQYAPEVECLVMSSSYGGQYVDITVKIKPVAGTEVAVFCNCPEDYMNGYETFTDEDLVKQLFVSLGEYYRSSVTTEGGQGSYGTQWSQNDEGFWVRNYSFMRSGTDLIYSVKSPNGYYAPVVIDLEEEIGKVTY